LEDWELRSTEFELSVGDWEKLTPEQFWKPTRNPRIRKEKKNRRIMFARPTVISPGSRTILEIIEAILRPTEIVIKVGT
tara:strand:+ start:4647 stop:4883 length:237 start_codon:yes stop_codon:yes gene_type:complete